MKKILSIILSLVIMISLFGCNKKEAAKDDELSKIKKAGKIVLGTSADYPPYEFHKVINGQDEIVGFDIEIAKQIAKDLGVELEIKDMKFDGLLAALQAGKIDFIVSGMTPTEERKKSVDFSDVYYYAVQTVVIRAEDKDKYKTLEDLKGAKVGVQKGSIQEGLAQKYMANSEIKAVGKISDIFLSLKDKKIDAAIIEQPVAQANVNKNKDLMISEIKLESEDAGSAIAVRKNSGELLTKINKSLKNLMDAKKIDEFVIKANELVD